MIQDPNLFNYTDSIIHDNNINDLKQKKKAYENYINNNSNNKTIDYEDQCNQEYLKILNNSFNN